MSTSCPLIDHFSDLSFLGWGLARFLCRWGRVRCLRLRPHLWVHFFIWILFLCRYKMSTAVVTFTFVIFWNSLKFLIKNLFRHLIADLYLSISAILFWIVFACRHIDTVFRYSSRVSVSYCVVSEAVIPSGGSSDCGPAGRKPVMAHSIISLVWSSTPSASSFTSQEGTTLPARTLATYTQN